MLRNVIDQLNNRLASISDSLLLNLINRHFQPTDNADAARINQIEISALSSTAIDVITINVEWNHICLITELIGATTGNIGKSADLYWSRYLTASAQKCGGVQKNTTKKNKKEVKVKELVTAAWPIKTGIQPAMPPQTIFCDVFFLSIMVYPKT